MFKSFSILCLFLFCFNSLFADELAGITFLTEEYPPFNYVEDGKLKGLSSDILKEIFKKVGTSKTINKDNIEVWSVAYFKAKNIKDVCLFSTTRTSTREPLFAWVGPIAATTISVVAPKKSNIKINSVEDLKKYKIGVVREDIAHQLLQEKGVNSNLQLTSDNKGNLDMLNKGFIQLWAYESNCAFWQIKQEGFNINDYEIVHTLKESEVYFAFNKDSNKQAVEAMQAALDELRKSGKVDEIIATYTK